MSVAEEHADCNLRLNYMVVQQSQGSTWKRLTGSRSKVCLPLQDGSLSVDVDVDVYVDFDLNSRFYSAPSYVFPHLS